MTRPAPARAGFTLVEVVGAFFLTVVVLFLVTGIFVENGRQRAAATALMRERLAATGALALLAEDLEGAVHVVRGEGVDPDAHPWRFEADAPGDLGATAIRFVTQNAPRRNAGEHAGGWVEVAWFLEEDADGELVLWRWRSPRPPSEVTRGLPDSSEPGAMRITEGVSRFGVRLLDTEGAWVDEWSSVYQPPELAVPEAAEISLELLRDPRPGEIERDEARPPGLLHARRVAFAISPIDVARLIELGAGTAGEAACYTIEDCLAEGDTRWYEELLDDDCGGDDELCDLLDSAGSECFSRLESAYPEVAARAPEACGG
ncbi:MAG TPA: type II secretion system protein GspJ [Myxococcota bacterium]|nr:hypothetical protein [Myxococcales bacterium]HPG26586.1 type II secretion system protein GspJ [Myxococcota bacterium]